MRKLGSRMAVYAVVAAATAGGWACNGGEFINPEADPTRSSDTRVTVAMTAPDSVRVGDAFPVTVVLRNSSKEAVPITLGGDPSRIQFDVTVTRPDGEEVWRYALTERGRAAILRVHTRILAPGEAIELTAVWDLRTNSGRAATPGTYRIKGLVYAAPSDLRTEDHDLIVIP